MVTLFFSSHRGHSIHEDELLSEAVLDRRFIYLHDVLLYLDTFVCNPFGINRGDLYSMYVTESEPSGSDCVLLLQLSLFLIITSCDSLSKSTLITYMGSRRP